MSTFEEQVTGVTVRLAELDDPNLWLARLGIGIDAYRAVMTELALGVGPELRDADEVTESDIATVAAAFQVGVEWGVRYAPRFGA